MEGPKNLLWMRSTKSASVLEADDPVQIVVTGLLPGRESIGLLAPILLVTMCFAQGFGVGGGWGSAVLMAVEHAPILEWEVHLRRM